MKSFMPEQRLLKQDIHHAVCASHKLGGVVKYDNMAGDAQLERATSGSGDQRSIHLRNRGINFFTHMMECVWECKRQPPPAPPQEGDKEGSVRNPSPLRPFEGLRATARQARPPLILMGGIRRRLE